MERRFGTWEMVGNDEHFMIWSISVFILIVDFKVIFWNVELKKNKTCKSISVDRNRDYFNSEANV